ncbi:MAG: amino acid transporter [Gammaproteobacteria bacterium RIFCSPHIGHO2_12_FULL_42_13]|nr:MAG: amino acid transporter [Gammaproteobacteria bacterium RIFCSPHIGHO2_12_FULL_42_13]
MSKTIGGTFLVLGTSVGAGILSLPLITAACGFGTAILLITLSWSVMYYTGLQLLEACSKYPVGVNFTTLIDKKISRRMQVIFTICYCLLLYSLLAAYTTQGADTISLVLHNDVHSVSINALVFLIIFGAIITGYQLSDYANRTFLLIKFLFFIISIFIMLKFFTARYLLNATPTFSAVLLAWPTLLPAFGFQNIIPVLYEYQNGNKNAVKKSITYGSILVLGIYIFWIFACFSILPQRGIHSYESIYKHGNNLLQFISAIKNKTGGHWVKYNLQIFINISIITSFICCGLSLLHYIKDIFQRIKIKISNTIGVVTSLLPPYFFSILYPNGFILALQYASIFAVIVFVYTPMLLCNKKLFSTKNLYPLILGTLVIIAQVLNLLPAA